MSEAVLGLGSNLGDRVKNINDTIKCISLLPKTEILSVSRLYETEPFMVPDEQNNYINACVRVFTKALPETLLGMCLGIEAGFGRERPYRFAPRVIDVDLLLYDNLKICTSDLILPHLGIKQRDFVLLPLADVCTDLCFFDFDFSKEFHSINSSYKKI